MEKLAKIKSVYLGRHDLEAGAYIDLNEIVWQHFLIHQLLRQVKKLNTNEMWFNILWQSR